MKVGIIGASGYTGAELMRLLDGHPEAQVTYLTADTYRDSAVSALYPHLLTYPGVAFSAFQLEEALRKAELFFVALPHGKAMGVVPLLRAAEAKVIDLSADFRLENADEYQAWYEAEHTSPDLLGEAVYGLPEFFREQVKSASLVAVPGCYPTAVLLALAPLLAEGVVEGSGLIADAKSGVSGAGRSLTLGTHFPQCNECVAPYNVGRHRHTPEIQLYLSRIAGAPVNLMFAPHLVPMDRGILATCYGKLQKDVSTEELVGLYRDFYADSQFVHIMPAGEMPQSKHVRGSNYCQVSPMASSSTGMAVAVAAIDNLVKGASGAAVQCMNLMTGMPEGLGLGALPIFP